jgi:plastocyanin domain-containing protein
MRTRIILTLLLGALLCAAGVVTAQAQGRAKTKARKPQAQTVKVVLTGNGYQPHSFKLKKGVPARVTFVRRTEAGCGREIALPAYGIRRALPLNRPVTVRFTPAKTGRFSFTCGMGMMRGTIFVE